MWLQSGGSRGWNHRKAFLGARLAADAGCRLRFQWGFWLKHLHVASLCGLGVLTAWHLGSEREHPKREQAKRTPY